jgi:hypothetical protein
MLFQDGQKFILDQEDIDELTSVFPEYMTKKKAVRITYNANVVQKIETNNPAAPFVFSKPTFSINLSNTWVDYNTGEQREIRFSYLPARYRSDGSSYFEDNHIIVDHSFVFKPGEDMELLWFCYNFSKLFTNSKIGQTSSPFQFIIQHKLVEQKTSTTMSEAKTKVALGELPSDKLIAFAKTFMVVDEEDTQDIILAKIFSTMDTNAEFKKFLISKFDKDAVDEDVISLVEKAISTGLLKSNEDGDQVLMVINGKETIVADIPFDAKGLLIAYVSKEKKLYSQLKKALS